MQSNHSLTKCIINSVSDLHKTEEVLLSLSRLVAGKACRQDFTDAEWEHFVFDLQIIYKLEYSLHQLKVQMGRRYFENKTV